MGYNYQPQLVNAGFLNHQPYDQHPGFIASDEAGAGPFHKQRVLNADYSDTVRTTIYTGRPMRSLARIFQKWAGLGKTWTNWMGEGVLLLLWMRIPNLDDWKSWHILTVCLGGLQNRHFWKGLWRCRCSWNPNLRLALLIIAFPHRFFGVEWWTTFGSEVVGG